MGQVEGKVAIVTGGASGIGAACAATLAREDAKVVITDIDDAGAQAVVGKIVAAGGEAICLKYAVPAMRRAGGGSIIITSSVAGLRGSAGLAGYCATKGGVRLFAKAVAMECAAEGDGIRINTVHPGVIDTPIWTKISSAAGRNTPIDPNEVSKSGVPLSRVGQAQDIANGVLFLASDASSYMTGAELVIDGGMTGGAVRRWT